MQVKIINKSEFPLEYATSGSSAVDLRSNAQQPIRVPPGTTHVIQTGIFIECPKGYCAVALPRSGKGIKEGAVLANLVGLIDEDYRGEILVALWNRNHDNTDKDIVVHPGDRIAQLMLIPYLRAEFIEVESLNETARGEGGLGSTGSK